MEKSLVSVVIPAYNVEEYIGQCLESIMSQSYTNLEIIVVDDGSTDQTRNVIENYLSMDSRIHMYSQQNSFAGIARNYGMDHSNGEYILFLDSDDYYDANMIKDMLANILKWKSDMVICNATYLDVETGEMIDPTYYFSPKLLNKEFISRKSNPELVLSIGNVVPWNKLFRMEFLKKYGLRFQQTKRNNDEYFVVSAKALAERISWIDKRYVVHRINNRSSLQGYEGEIECFDLYEVYVKIRSTLLQNNIYEELKPYFFDKIICGCVAMLKKMRTYSLYYEMYSKLVNKIFIEFDFYNINEDYFYSQKENYMCLKTLSANEYLFYCLCKLKQRNEKYPFPFLLLGKYTKIAIYGAGKVGKAYVNQLRNNSHYELTNWYDKNYAKLGVEVENPKFVKMGDYEKIIIAIYDNRVACDVENMMIEEGVPPAKIIKINN